MHASPIKAGDRVVVARVVGAGLERIILGARGVVLEARSNPHGYARVELDACPVPALLHPESLDHEAAP